ncbi:hypothetical protein DPEC_G00229800 [Dallia pectoralis]|uniref:Uncharacterized protein n=1 Tax=Dallia pectoralis TaxID=75939 RepID=A0ACC2G1P6_DALPE|nr:hypothetical protein DPEC_G00229800 [Dallia pectoralis]
MWLLAVLTLLLAPYLPQSINISEDPGGSSNALNHSETLAEGFPESSARSHNHRGAGQGPEACTIPCDVTAKMLREEKHSMCGKHIISAILFYHPSYFNPCLIWV